VADTPSNPTVLDSEVLRRAQAGDEGAFGEIMRKHYEQVFRLIHAIVRNEHDARDVAQEVWLTIWKKLPTFRGDSKFTTWVHPIAVRRAVDHLRKRKRWYDRFLPFSIGDDSVHAAPEPSTNENSRQQAESSERSDQLKTALDGLPAKLRAVLALREIEGLSYEEIAEVTAVPIGTVMSRLYNARRLLVQKLKNSP
jgi:RNA polymerase sigma-70 factor, ECF subfamily